MIDSVYNTVTSIIDKEQRGGLSPQEFNDLVNLAVNSIYNEYGINKYINRGNRGLLNSVLGDKTKMERERWQHFINNDVITLVNGAYTLPADCNYVDFISYNGAEVDECKSGRDFNLYTNSDEFSASEDYPIYLKRGRDLYVSPITIIDDLVIDYIRKPLKSKWTYTTISDTELFNPSASDYQDIDLHDSEESNVIIKVLASVGIHLKEQDLEQFANVTENKKEQKDNIV